MMMDMYTCLKLFIQIPDFLHDQQVVCCDYVISSSTNGIYDGEDTWGPETSNVLQRFRLLVLVKFRIVVVDLYYRVEYSKPLYKK